MRNLSTPPRPSTATNKNEALKTRNVVKGYPELLRFDINHVDDDSFEILPASLGSLNKFSRFTFEVGTEAFQHSITDDWTMDLTTTTIDLATFTGGIVDNIARANFNDYIFWTFLDADFEFSGIGLTKKPFEDFTSVGATAKGATGTFTVANGFQYTIGARCVVRNDIGTAPQYEWNWGTIVTVANTTLTILMDNEVYGSAISITAGGAGGQIIQWDKFRPWVVTATEQTLYKPYYTLLGETLLSATGTILQTYKASDEWRPITQLYEDVVSITAQSSAPSNQSIARAAPLWALKAGVILEIRSTATNDWIIADGPRLSLQGVNIVRTQTANVINIDSLDVDLGVFAQFVWNTTSSANIDFARIRLTGYRVPGGMRQ